MRHALALFLLLRHAQTQRCTSLAGPDCEIINGRAPARPPTNSAPVAKPSSWRERLLGVGKGAFEVRGDLPDAEGAFELVAGAWLDQPEGWITVGLRGRFEDNCTLSGEITDGEGDVMACVEIKIFRRVRAESSRRPPRHRRDVCSIAWWCSFLTARPSQDGHAIPEKMT